MNVRNALVSDLHLLTIMMMICCCTARYFEVRQEQRQSLCPLHEILPRGFC